MESTNKKQIITMSIAAVLGGAIGGVVGMWWMNPAMLIPIGVVVGLSIGLAISNAKK